MTGKLRKILGMALAVCMIVSCLTGYGKEEVKAAQTPVKYLDYNESYKRFEEKSCNAYSVVGTTTTSMTEQDSWYVVNGVVTVSGRISVTGTVNLILMNGCMLTASEGIGVNAGDTLRIYRQARSEGTTTTPGELVATGSADGAGIGGSYGHGGRIDIFGGTVTATSTNGAGIGGGFGGEGNIIICGGTVTAFSDEGAGIGGGTGGGGNITINGGAVNAESRKGAGIGGGEFGAGGNIRINGGTVTAYSIFGAGMGSGKEGAGGNIAINGGTVTASSFLGAGIGNGADASGAGSYSIGTGMKGFSSASENSGYSSLSNSFSDTSQYAIVYRENGFIPSVSNSTITARYIADGNRKSITLRIQEPTDIILNDVNSAKAKLVGCDTFNTALGRTGADEVSESQIKYYNSAGQELPSAPIAKGSYTAKITVDGFTASVNYSIKYTPVVTPPVGATHTFNGDEQPLITGGSTTGGTLKYSLSENGTFSTDIPKGRDGGPYTVYYKVEGNDDYKSTTVSHVSAEIRQASLSLSLSQASWVKGDTVPGPVLLGNEGSGAVTYAYKKQSEDNTAYVDNAVPTEAGNYVVRAIVAETGNYLGGTVTAEFTITEPEYALPTAIQNLIYTRNPQRLVNPGSVSGGAISYSLTEDGIYSGDIPTGTEAGDYIVYYKVIGRDGVTTVTGSSITVSIAKKSLELTLSQEGWVKGSTASDSVLGGNEGDGTVTYAYKKQSEDNTAYVDNAVPTESGDYVVRATVAETGNYLGGTVTADFTITEPEPTSEQTPDTTSGTGTEQTPDTTSGTGTEQTPEPSPAPVIDYQPDYYPEEPKPAEKKDDGLTTTTEVKNPDGTISEISVTKLADGSVTRETVRDKDGKFVEYKYEYTRTKKNGTTFVQTFNEKADGSKKETSVTTTKSGTVSTKVKEQTADGTVISKEGKSYADGRTSLKEAITGSDGVTKVVTEKSDAAGKVVWAEYASIKDDANILLTTAEVTGTTLKLPDEIWVNEQYFVVAEIGKNALKNNKTVSKLTIGENVTKIGSSAFRNMTKLKSITINAANLESIGKNAFKGVGDKKRVTITIKGVTEAEFERICDMIRAAGIGKKVKFVMG